MTEKTNIRIARWQDYQKFHSAFPSSSVTFLRLLSPSFAFRSLPLLSLFLTIASCLLPAASPLYSAEFEVVDRFSVNNYSEFRGSVTIQGKDANPAILDTRTQSGAAALFISTNSNVGIGTTGPGTKLDVAGNVKIVDGTQGAGKVLTSDANGVASWQTSAGGIPSGAVMFFNLTSCPSGWTELTSARGRVVVGLPASGTLAGTQGTALGDLGARTITDVPMHTHSIDPPATATDSQGSHTHNIPKGSSGGGGNFGNGYSGSVYYQASEAAGAHTHTVDIAPLTSGSMGSASVDVSMPYLQLLACQKS